VIQLDPDTLWRPRGTEVRFTVSSSSGPAPHAKAVLVCFKWALASPTPTPAPEPLSYTPSPLVRSVPNSTGLLEYGALLPDLPNATREGTGPSHTGAVEYTAVGTVPLADMQVLIELDDSRRIAVVLPVGVTRVSTAVVVLAVSLVLSGLILWRLAPPAFLGSASGWTLRHVSRRVLSIIAASNGVASLSNFQIMLWTFVVGGAAVYVMTLSGNLISISGGTLTLLGIAGGTTILARISPGQTTAVDPGAPAVVYTPRWSQLLVSDAATADVDVTRVQMLMFTLIMAAFVGIKVAVSYSIPEIPDNFLVLMGISNGVYLAGRQIQPGPKGAGA
jgi:hypothetical protein